MTSRHSALLAYALVFLATLLPEFALVERKFAIFAGGFGQSHALAGPSQVALFVAALVAAHGWFLALVMAAMRWLHRRAARPIFLYNFVVLTSALWWAALAAKFEVLSYFSDAVSFGLLRNLGGGSLLDAFLFALSDGALLFAGVAVGAVAWLVGLLLLRARCRKRPAPPAGGPHWWPLLAALPALALLMFAANGQPNDRYALARFTAYGLVNEALSQATDFDRDGFSWFTPQIDRQPFDAGRHPLALDIPDNGVDEDGFAGDFRFDGRLPATAPVAIPASGRKHVVVIVLESTRGDSIGRVVDGRPVTPNMNRLAASGTRVAEAYSHVGFTTGSLKSLFTGRIEPAGDAPSLFRDFKRAGYRIGVFSGQPETFGDIASVTAMKASADIFVDADTLRQERAFSFAAKGSLLVDGRKLLREFDRRLGDRAGWARPTFLYFNVQAPHFPYAYPELPQILPGKPIPRGDISIANRAWVARTYWNAVAYADWQVGQIVARLKALGVYDDTLLLVTADHGESLFDDGFLGHGHIINRQQTRIPLILNRPGLSIEPPVGLTDYRAILLGALGVKAAPPQPAGRPVFQFIGQLDAPAAIGLVERGGRWTVLTLDTEDVWFSDLDRRTRYADLPPPLRARADAVVREWERQRWLRHIATSRQ